jgi:hypothetical protein
MLTKSAEMAGRHEHAAVIILLEDYSRLAGGSLPLFVALLDAYLQSAEAEKISKGVGSARVSEAAEGVVK